MVLEVVGVDGPGAAWSCSKWELTGELLWNNSIGEAAD